MYLCVYTWSIPWFVHCVDDEHHTRQWTAGATLLRCLLVPGWEWSSHNHCKKDDLPRIRNSIIKAQCIYSCKAALDEIVRGLNSVNIGPMIRSHPKPFPPLYWIHQSLSHQEHPKTCSLWIWPMRGPTCAMWEKKQQKKNQHCSGSASYSNLVKMVAYLFKMTIHRHQSIWSLCITISFELCQNRLNWSPPYRLCTHSDDQFQHHNKVRIPLLPYVHTV